MNYKSHIIGTLTAAGIAIPILAYEFDVTFLFKELVMIMPGLVFGGLFPDIDTKSKMEKIYAIFGLIVSIYWLVRGKFLYIIVLFAPFIAAKIDKHRGWTHRYPIPILLILAAFTIEFIAYRFPDHRNIRLFYEYRYFIGAFGIGWIIHLILDRVF